MKVGSLVECVKGPIRHDVPVVNLEVGGIYTVRGIYHDPISRATGITLEEVVNRLHPRIGREMGYDIRRFRELQEPGSVNIEALLEESLLQPA